ncbi:hypothetical protein Taro_003244 [Colocasia esculenta]|uniref:Uncharacterized protein n=1 Tax=Colocasia esculenta TaxID=4460 RepID=A0A843TN40_COLES|nr:hypothetical protein [Colocasia esculenta]
MTLEVFIVPIEQLSSLKKRSNIVHTHLMKQLWSLDLCYDQNNYDCLIFGTNNDVYLMFKFYVADLWCDINQCYMHFFWQCNYVHVSFQIVYVV